MFSALSSGNLMVIPFSEIKGVQVGNACDDKAKTGVTVFYFPSPATAAVKIFGGGPASRETPLLEPERNSLPLNALVFGGGSAYGLAAADGVMRRMEEIVSFMIFSLSSMILLSSELIPICEFH